MIALKKDTSAQYFLQCTFKDIPENPAGTWWRPFEPNDNGGFRVPPDVASKSLHRDSKLNVKAPASWSARKRKRGYRVASPATILPARAGICQKLSFGGMMHGFVSKVACCYFGIAGTSKDTGIAQLKPGLPNEFSGLPEMGETRSSLGFVTKEARPLAPKRACALPWLWH